MEDPMSRQGAAKPLGVQRQTVLLGAVMTGFNSVQTRCIVKARLRKVNFSGDFLGVVDFLRIACSLGIPQDNL